MFGFFKTIFKHKTKELEAKLLPTAECTYGGVGEIEISFYSDGEIKLELSLKHSGVPNQSRLEFYSGNDLLGTAEINGGYAKNYVTLSNRTVDISIGSIAELRINGTTLYGGKFRPD